MSKPGETYVRTAAFGKSELKATKIDNLFPQG